MFYLKIFIWLISKNNKTKTKTEWTRTGIEIMLYDKLVRLVLNFFSFSSIIGNNLAVVFVFVFCFFVVVARILG